jgi:hypothetical protein
MNVPQSDASEPVKLRVEVVAIEMIIVAAMIVAAGFAQLPGPAWVPIAVIVVVGQSVLFYNLGRMREKLEPGTELAVEEDEDEYYYEDPEERERRLQYERLERAADPEHLGSYKDPDSPWADVMPRH